MDSEWSAEPRSMNCGHCSPSRSRATCSSVAPETFAPPVCSSPRMRATMGVSASRCRSLAPSEYACSIHSSNCMYHPRRRLACLALDLELIARHESHDLVGCERLPTEREAELGERSIRGEIHIGRVFIARLVVALGGVLLALCLAPLRRVPGEFDSGVDGERGHPGARETEMIRPVIVAGAGLGIGLDVEAEGARGLPDHGKERGAFGARDVHRLRHADGRDGIEIQIECDLRSRDRQ